MKILINKTTEIDDVTSVVEKILNSGELGLDITLNDSNQEIETLQAAFADVKEIDIVRTDLNGEESTINYTKFTKLTKAQRRIVDETDVTTITLEMEKSEE